MASILKSPIEDALSKAPAFGLPETFQQSTEGRQQPTFTPGNVPFQSEFNAASQRYGVPVNVLMALAQQESSFNPTALGQPTKYGRAKGLMQYIDSTAAGMGINPYDPVQSIDAVAKQLKTRLDQGYSMQEAVQAHFGGDDRRQWGEKTRAYGAEVMGKAQRFFDGTPGTITQGTQQQQPAQRDYAAEYPAAQSAMENMGQTELRTRAQRMDKLLGDLNAEEPGRYRALTPEEVQQYMAEQAKANPQPSQADQQQAQPSPAGDTTALTEATQRLEGSQQKTAEQNKGIIDSALEAISDGGQLLKSGVNIAAQDARELVSRIPYVGKSIVEGADSVDRWMNGKGSEEIFKAWDKNVEKNLSPEMVSARKKAWVVEPGDDLGNGKKATSYSFGPAWSDPRAYASGLLESLPEMAVTMGGSGRLAQFAYKRAIASGMSREAAAKAASRTALVAGSFLEGGLGGASSARETREQIMQMNPEQLKDSTAMKSLMASGKSFEDARKEVAESAASQAFVLAGIGTGLFGGMGDRAMAKIITGNSGRLKSAITGFIGEGFLEEVPQSALQQMGQNYAMQEADPNTPLMKGVANQAAGGLAVGGLMGAGMGAAAPRVGNDTQPGATQDAQPSATQDTQPQVDPAQAMEEEAVATAPTPGRDDTGLSDDAGPLERATRGTAPQPDATNGNFWGGEPGATINMQAKGDPDTAMVATVERYERDGSMTVRSEDGTPYTVSPDEVDITAAATAPQSTSQQVQDAGTAQEVKDERAAEQPQEDPETAAKRQDAIRQALEQQGVDPDTGEVLGEKKPSIQVKAENAPVERPLTDLSEEELRDRMRYFARQAKQSGWDTRLTKARRDVEKVLNAKIKEREKAEASIAAGNAEQQPGTEMAAAAQADQPGTVRGGAEGSAADRGAGLSGDVRPDTVAGPGRSVDANTPATVASTNGGEALAGADNKPKWFSTAEKAQKHLDKRKLSGFSVVETKANRFELHADGPLTNEGTTAQQNNDDVSATAPAPKAAQTPVNPRTNRARKLVGDVGEIVSPDGDVGLLSAGGQYQITRIDKNGTVHVMNRETAGNTTITPAEMERARSRNVNWSKTDVPTAVAETVAKSAPAAQEAKQQSATAESAVTAGAEEIPYRTVAFDQEANGGAGGKVESSGKSPVINFGGRMMVLVRMGGRKVPFYLSTGKGGKADVPDGKWYPFFGIGADGWINKTGGKDMTSYYGSDALREKAQELDRVLGDVRNDETVPKVAATGSHIDAINASFPNATENGRSDTLTKVQQSIADVVGGVAKSATVQTNEQQAATEQYVAERVMSQEEVNEKGDWHLSPWLFADGRIVGSNGDHISLSDQFDHSGYRDMSLATGAIRSTFHKATSGHPEDVDFVSLQLFDDQKLTPAQYKTVESFVRANNAKILLGVDRSGNNMNNVEQDEVTLSELRNHTAQQPESRSQTVAKPASAERETKQGEDWTRFDDDSGTLLVPRDQMPQIKAEHRGALVNFLNARGISHQEEAVPASSLKPTQAEYSPSRVTKAAERTEGDRAILVDKTGQILDGHHQWMAAKEKGEDIRVIRFDADILDLLNLGQEFPSSTVDTSSAQQKGQKAQQNAPKVNQNGQNVNQNTPNADNRATPETTSNEGAKAEAGKSEAETAAKDADRFAENKLFTADKVAAARARMKSKFGQLNSGLDPELLVDGMTIAGAYIESGVRKFSDYAKAMVDDFGDGVKPYLLSFWEGARNYPGLDNEGMTSVADSAAEHQEMLTPAVTNTPAVGEVVAKPAKRSRKTGQKGDITLTQDFGVDHIDGYGENTSGRETGSDLKDEFLKNGRAYLNAVADQLENVGFTPTKNAKGKFVGAVNVNPAGDAVSGDITLAMDGPNGTGIYMNVSGVSLRGAVPTTVSGVGIMYRATTPNDKTGSRSTNQWAPVDLSASDLATLVAGHAENIAQRDAYRAEQEANRALARPTGGLDDMVSNFDAEVTNNGTATELGKPGESALGGVPANEVRGAEEGREAGRSPAGGRAADSQRNERSGAERDAAPRSVGDDAGAVPVSTSGRKPAERGTGAERGSAARDNGDAAGRGRVQPASGVTAQDKPADLFTINADEIGQGGDKAKYANNVAAIRLLKELEATNRQATATEQAVLAKYVGWGGLPGAFERTDGTANKGWEKQVAELKSLLTPEELAAAAASTRNAHYTSPEIVSGMWKLMQHLGFTGGRVIEPSVGVGNFFGLMPQGVRSASALHGVELDRITSGIATQLYPEAKIARMGYQEYAIPDGYFDVAVGNPPFGSEKLYDGNRKDLSGFSIHNYFFARTVDALRPGGVMAMVVTNRFLDGASDKARQYIGQRADLVGAIRLPNNAFSKNAGTEVTTDIIVLRKRLPGEAPSAMNRSWLETTEYTDKQGNVVPLNKYFVTHPENMLGEFGAYGTMYRKGDTALVARDGQNTAQLLEQAINRFPANIMAPAVEVKPETRETVKAENVRVGSMFVDGSGRVLVRGEDQLGERTGTAVEFRSVKAEERVKGMLRVRDSLVRLRQLQLSNTASDRAIDEARAQLNKTYDGFVKANGPINSQANKLLFRDDPTWPQISALEDEYDKGISAEVARRTGEEPRKQSAKKAAIFSRRTQQPYSAPTSAASAKDALVATLAERGRIDMAMMESLYGKSPEDIASELGDLIYNDPATGWQTRDAYLSGNVKAKLAAAEEAAKTDPQYARNVEALRQVQPKDIEAVDISVKPGASWVPTATMAQFADHIAESTGSSAFYNPLTANWSFPKLTPSSSASTRYGTGRLNVGQILEAAAAQKAVQVFDTHQDGSRTLNETETQLANDKVNQVKQEWDRWLWSDDTRRAELSRLYNDQFNTDVMREFDGAHLTFPGKISDDIIRLRPHQNNFVWRVVQGGNTLADHVVGAGKTFSLIAAAMELRRMGLARKPVFTVPNHLVGQWAQDFIKLYPGANVLAATKADFEKANRKRFFARIATGDWDAVIVAHSSFGKVGVKPETEAEFIREEIADLTSSIEAIEEAEGKRSRNVKQAQERKAKMEERLKKLLDTDNKDDSLYWDDLGIDALFVDEAHEFKNLAYSSGMRGVAGMGNPSGSQKATDMYMKTRIVRKATGGRNVVFATGTPISNTMAEMYTMQRYLDYDNLKASGLAHFDAWARMFGEVVTDWELSPSGQYKMNSRFSKFVNMPELMQRYGSFADVINRDDINRQLAAQGKRLPVPKVKGGKPQNIVVPRSDAQADYIGEPIKDADGNDTDNFPEGTLVYRAEHLPKKAEKGGDNMLKIMSDARKAALDMRLIDPDARDNPYSKVNDAADRIKADYDTWSADRGAQLVFIDLSTPKGARADEAARIRDLIERSESKDPDIADAAQAELDKISPDEIEALNAAFSVYDDLKQKLVDRGIPAAEIAFIHDAKTDLQKTELFGKVRSGRVRVLFGSTAKMGAGMNVQERLVALHHLDAPWRPSDLEQREGRIIRQGNRLYDRDPEGFEVGIYRYATKQTLDSRMWQTIEGKANFIEQVRKGATGVREVEDIAGEAANAAEMKAASSGNPLILEEMTLRQRIRSLENERTAHDRDQFRIRDRIRQEESNVRVATRTLDELREDAKLAQPAKFEATIDGQTFDKRKDAGEAIISTAAQMEKAGIEQQAIGTYGGFKLSLSRAFAGSFILHVTGNGDYTAKVDLQEGMDPTGMAMRMTNTVKDLDGAIEQMEQAQQRSQKAIPSLQEQVKPWPKEKQLADAMARHAEVIEKLRPKKKTAEQSVAETATKEPEPQQNDIPATFNDWDTSYARLPEGNRIQLNTRLRKLQQQKALGQITPEQYSDHLAELADWLEQRTMENAAKRALAERQRGADMVLERLHRARRQGDISEHAADIAIWALNRNPHLAEDLGISIRQKGGSQYDIVERIARLMTENMRDTAPIHEILHHTERMLPPGVQKGIAAEYNAAWKRAYKNASPELRAALDAMRLSAFGDKAAREATMKAFESGLLQYHQHYQLTNASEYWAVNAAEIMARRHMASTKGWIARAREWMSEFIRKVKSVFGLQSDAAVLRGLQAVMKGDGSFQSGSMIAINPVADTPLRDQQGDYADQPHSPSGMDPAPNIPTPEEDNARVRSWWDKLKNLPRDKMTDAMEKGLAVVPMRPLVLELGRNLPAAAEYMRLKQSMDAMRNTWHARTDAVAQRWLKYRKDNDTENAALMDLMHEDTIAQVDSSQKFEPMMTPRDHDALRAATSGSEREAELIAKAAEDTRRRQAWEGQRAKFQKLSPEAQAIYRLVRDEYTAIADEYEKVLMGNMEKAINVRIKKAEREHRYDLQRITDEGLTGQEKQEAIDEANRKLKIAKTKTAWNRKARITQLRQQFETERLQGPYFPLARFGNYFVTVRDAESGKVESFSRFEKASEQREFADLMGKDPKYTVQIGVLDDAMSTRKAVDANFVADVEDILADLPNAEQVKDEVWQRYLETLPDFSIRKNRIHRTGRKGYNADALRAFGNQMFHSSHQLARLAHTFDMDEALDAAREEAQHSSDPNRDGMVVNEMNKRHEFVMNPKGGPLVQMISQASFIYFLAASPKAAIVNLSQTAIMGVPILGAYDGSNAGMVRAANQLMRALGDFTRGKGEAMKSKRLTPDERKAMQEAYDTGIIDRTQSHDLAGIGETGVEYSPARTKVMALLAWGFHQGERLNREVTFLAAYRMAKAKGLPHKEAVAKANDLTWKTHFDYQNTSRPRVMHSDTMKALLVFRNFSINMLWRLFRDIHQATKGDTPEVKREARIQLAGTTGMMMLNAGLTGTWFFGIAMMLAGMFMDDGEDPEAELKKNMIEALGPQMAGIILDGVPGYVTGTSLSDSIGMRDLWFRDPSTSLEGKGAMDYWKSQLLGAPPSIIDNAIKGYSMIKEGQVYRGIETIMPKAIKDPMKAYRYATEGATNKRGDVIVDDIDAADIIRQTLGFTPAKLAEQYDLNNAGFNRQDAILKQRKALMDSYWKADEAGDDARLDKLEADIDKYNDKYPEMEITPKSLSRSAKTREKNAEDATGGMRYNRKLRDRILDEQSPTVYR